MFQVSRIGSNALTCQKLLRSSVSFLFSSQSQRVEQKSKTDREEKMTISEGFSNGSVHASEQVEYSERAISSSEMSRQMQGRLFKQKAKNSKGEGGLSEIFHHLLLVEEDVLAFDYDYFTQSLVYMLDFQSRLSLAELYLVLKLAERYKLGDNQLIKTHYQSELLYRLNEFLGTEIQQEQHADQQYLKKLYSGLERHSQDHFEILNSDWADQEDQNDCEEEFIDLTELSPQEEQSNLLTEQAELEQEEVKDQMASEQVDRVTADSHEQKKREVQPFLGIQNPRSRSMEVLSNSILMELSELTLKLNSSNQALHSIFLEGLELRYRKTTLSQDPDSNSLEVGGRLLLCYARHSVQLLTLLMKKYQDNSKSYTRRSIKKIYKLQTSYYLQMIKLLRDENLRHKITKEQFLEFVSIIERFPIKRRMLKKQLGTIFIEMLPKYDVEYMALKEFFQMSKNDKSMLTYFQKIIKDSQLIHQNQEWLPSDLYQKRDLTAEKEQPSEAADGSNAEQQVFYPRLRSEQKVY